MTTKKSVFFKKQLDNLPFFLRNYKIKELQIDIDESKRTVSYFDQNPVYHTENMGCSLPQKPISKMLTFDEQKNF